MYSVDLFCVCTVWIATKLCEVIAPLVASDQLGLVWIYVLQTRIDLYAICFCFIVTVQSNIIEIIDAHCYNWPPESALKVWPAEQLKVTSSTEEKMLSSRGSSSSTTDIADIKCLLDLIASFDWALKVARSQSWPSTICLSQKRLAFLP